MSEHKNIYHSSRRTAKEFEEMDEWQESYLENCKCARAIEEAITKNYVNYRLNEEGAKSVIKKFGYDRVNWVLANTVMEGKQDGRYSQENKSWARGFDVPKEEDLWNYNFSVTSHPAIVDLFVVQVRNEWQSLGLWERNQCYDGNLDYKGKVVALSPSVLKDEYKTPDYQLFYASVGNGCSPDAIGTKVFGHFLKDGEKTYFRRGQILGVVKLDLLPDWAKAKLADIFGSEPQSKNTETEKVEPPTSGGIGEIK